jgi:lipoate-protein ligase A
MKMTTDKDQQITGTRKFRFINSGKNSGSMNMAIDEAVLTGLREGISTPVIRIYSWNPATISIGYFQSAEDIDLESCRNDGIGVVRRMTGGRAVLHDHELTYSFLCTEQDFQPFKKKEIFLFIAQCLVNALNWLGIESKVAEKTAGDLRSANCFAAPAQFEIESIERGKLIGSAQVIKDGVLLQHGAIPLTDSYRNISKYLKTVAPFTKNISSLQQVSEMSFGEEELLKALREGFQKRVVLEDGKLTDFERDLAAKLAVEKYGNDDWMFRR